MQVLYSTCSTCTMLSVAARYPSPLPQPWCLCFISAVCMYIVLCMLLSCVRQSCVSQPYTSSHQLHIYTYVLVLLICTYVCWKLQLPCGHSCSLTCHPGACADVCRRRVTLRCSCKRLKKVSILSDFLTLPCIQSSLVYIHTYVCSSWFICHVFVLRPCHPFYVFPFAISVPNVGSKMLWSGCNKLSLW